MSFNRLVTYLAAPGAPRVIFVEAHLARSDAESPDKPVSVQRTWYSGLDRTLDVLVKWSGSMSTFCLITASLLAWAFAGIGFGHNTTWQVFISDYQALMTYFFDSLLMRQQSRDFDFRLEDYATIRSRMHTHIRSLNQIRPGPRTGTHLDTILFPTKSKRSRILTQVANVIGHIGSVLVFWIGIIVWLAFGKAQGWSNAWQLYCNSATSALMVFSFAFLASVRERHAEHIEACFDAIKAMDTRVEKSSRDATGDIAPNPSVTITFESRGVVQRAISYYAYSISMLVGIVILTAVVLLWLALGPAMRFGNSWWLFIGTYAGLVGMIDGFVLRNTDGQLSAAEETEWVMIDELDDGVSDRHSFAFAAEEPRRLSTTQRISNAMNDMCAHRYAVVGALVVTSILITAASVLEWSFTGQSLCNVPPSIIESFLMIVSISGHNHRNTRKEEWCEKQYKRRVTMLKHISGRSDQDCGVDRVTDATSKTGLSSEADSSAICRA